MTNNAAARDDRRHAGSRSGHEPTLAERLEFARSSMVIARFASRAGLDARLARREVERAQSEVDAVAEVIDAVRLRAVLIDGRPARDLGRLAKMSRQLSLRLSSASSEIHS